MCVVPRVGCAFCPATTRHRSIEWFAAISAIIVCGKFTAMATWAEVVAFSQPLTSKRYDKNGQPGREVTYRVTGNLPVIVWDAEKGQRRVIPMLWGFPIRRVGVVLSLFMPALS